MNVFTYGSLMFAPVWRRVVAGEYRSLPAVLRGYARRRIPGESYPALVEAAPESEVRGILYLDVSEADLRTLDRFEDEGSLYARVAVRVETEAGGEREAWSYLYLHPERTSAEAWDPERFEREGMALFLGTYVSRRSPGRS